MERQAGAQELLDGPLDPALLSGNLDDLERINRLGGGAELSWASLRQLIPRADAISLLDIGTGGADIPRHLLRRAAPSGVTLKVTATDVRWEIVDAARRRSLGIENLTIVSAADGSLEFADGSFDVAHASMVLHHLEPSAAIALLREMGRVARRGVVVNDLDRRRWWWLAARMMSTIATRNSYTRNDAPLSVARAYLADELAALATAAGLREVGRLRTRPGYRYALILVPR